MVQFSGITAHRSACAATVALGLSAGGVALAELLAVVARGAFEGVGTASGIWFRNARIHEAGVDGAWVQMNVLADFVYDEMR